MKYRFENTVTGANTPRLEAVRGEGNQKSQFSTNFQRDLNSSFFFIRVNNIEF